MVLGKNIEGKADHIRKAWLPGGPCWPDIPGRYPIEKFILDEVNNCLWHIHRFEGREQHICPKKLG